VFAVTGLLAVANNKAAGALLAGAGAVVVALGAVVVFVLAILLHALH
jgi:hypothetical protein